MALIKPRHLRHGSVTPWMEGSFARRTRVVVRLSSNMNESKNAPLNRCEGGWKWGRGMEMQWNGRSEQAIEEVNAFEHFPCRPPIAQGPALRRPMSAASD